jgi:lysophospholipase L1-like esterase
VSLLGRRGPPPPQRLPRAQRAARALALGLGCALAAGVLAVAELRQRSREDGIFVLAHDPPGVKYGVTRGPEPMDRGWRPGRAPMPRPPEARQVRVLALGDSVTWGNRVGAFEAWPAQLGRQTGWDVVNLGVPGWDASQSAALLEAEGGAWSPDAVVWGTFANDGRPTHLVRARTTNAPVFVGTDVPAEARLLPSPIGAWLLRHSALYRTLQGATWLRTPGAPSFDRAWYAAQVDRFAAWSARSGVPVVVMALAPHVLVTPESCTEGYGAMCRTVRTDWESLTAVLNSRRLPWVDTLPALRADGRPAFWPGEARDPDHPNPDAHAHYASSVEPILRAALER